MAANLFDEENNYSCSLASKKQNSKSSLGSLVRTKITVKLCQLENELKLQIPLVCLVTAVKSHLLLHRGLSFLQLQMPLAKH